MVGYIFYHYCLRFDQRGSLYGRLYCLSLLFRYDRGVVCIVVVGYIVYHYCLRFDREVVCIVVVGYTVVRGVVCIIIITVEGLTEEWFVLLW